MTSAHLDIPHVTEQKLVSFHYFSKAKCIKKQQQLCECAIYYEQSTDKEDSMALFVC